MIRWFKRKKKEDRGKAPEDTGKEQNGGRGAAEEENLSKRTMSRPTSLSRSAEDEAEHRRRSLPESDRRRGHPGEEEEEDEEEDETRRKTFRKVVFSNAFASGLKGTREKFVHRIDRLVLGKRVIDEDLLDELEEILITSDLGVKTTAMLLRKVADKVKRKELSDPAKLREQIRDEIRAVLNVEAPRSTTARPSPLSS